LKPDGAIYSDLITGFSKEGLVEEAMEAKRLMEEAGINSSLNSCF
jgi:pentatricopeptide repeat protein